MNWNNDNTKDDDGVTVTWLVTPVGTCGVLIGRPIDEGPSCRSDGRCQHRGIANGTRVQGCTLPKALCQNRPCPVKSAPEMTPLEHCNTLAAGVIERVGSCRGA